MSENLTTITENKGKSIKVLVEKLDGGYISDITGRRAIFKDAYAITEAMNLEEVIKNMDNAEYHLDINIIPKSEYADYNALVALHNSSEEELILESAKEAGIIESAEKFNPFPKMEEPNISGPIKIDATNCYGPSRLKAIDWKSLKEQIDMPISELAGIAGLNKQTFYNTWANIMLGKYTYQRVEIRIGLTILAKYFEKTLDVRTSTKEQCEKMKDDLNKMIRELEIMGSGKSHIKTSDVQKKLIEMRKVIL